ncbi:hypothetical protein [Phenylobacterium sp.]|uniref:hypothetical protein n=1 Tax=Phenylobacterium sp. TaxID=1871053 RepID=UPI00301CF9FB
MLAAAAAATIIAGGLAEADPARSPGAAGAADALGAPETKNRLSPEVMETLVAAPLAQIKGGDLAGGQATFEQLLQDLETRHGKHSTMLPDALSAFGVLIREPGYEAESLPYLKRAVAAGRTAFGPDDPELAVLLHDYAVALIIADEADPSPDADASAAEAYRIRRDALGPDNIETIGVLGLIGELQGLPSRTGGDIAKADAAVGLLRKKADFMRRLPYPDARRDGREALLKIAEVHARHGRSDKTQEAAEAWLAALSSEPTWRRDVVFDIPGLTADQQTEVLAGLDAAEGDQGLAKLAAFLEAAGEHRGAQRIRDLAARPAAGNWTPAPNSP